MTRLFTYIYTELSRHRLLTFAIVAFSFAVFCVFSAKITLEEDLLKLMPESTSRSASVAFSQLKVKDKLFVQVTSSDSLNPLGTERLAELTAEFADNLLAADSSKGCIDNLLYNIDDDMILGGVDYLTNYLPTFIDTSVYVRFDSLLTHEAIAARMKRNHEMIFDEGREDLAQLIVSDPAGLRFAFLADGNPLQSDGGFIVRNRQLFSPDSVVALMFLAPNFDAFNSSKGRELVKMIEDVRDEFVETHPEVDILFHGAAVQSAYNSRQIKYDLMFTILISLLIVCVVIWLSFHSYDTVLLLLMPVIYGAAFALAMVYWIQGTLSLMALSIGAIVLGVALSYVLHVFTHYKHVSDPLTVIREQARPVCLGCLTTIGAFAGLLFTDSPLLRDFGLFASLGLIGTTLFSLIFLPHFFRKSGSSYSKRAFGIMERLNSLHYDNPVLVSIIVVVCVICFYTHSWVTFDSDLNNIGYVTDNVRRSRELYSCHVNNGNVSQFYAVTSTSLDSAIQVNARLKQTVDSIKDAGLIAGTSSMSSMLVSTATQQERIDRWQEYWSEERIERVMADINSEGAMQGFDEGSFDMFESLLYADYEPGSLAEADFLPDALLSNIVELSGDNYLVFTSLLMPKENKDSVNDIIAAIPGAVVVDPFYYTNDLISTLHDDFNLVLWVSTLFVFIVLICSFRNLWYSIIAFLPMFLSWYVVQGIMGIFGLQFNLINIVISTFIFGIGVDYSIFIMDGMLAGDKSKLLMHHKTAILLSAFVLIVAVGSLIFAVHPVLKSIGITTLIGMSSTVLIAYSLQPFLFKRLCKWKKLS
ncbi:MAG: MMPL family transporter [Paludibacteraceae bacterium]|nr:MMPL family transporter [Paludibacteraceae bacterium]